MLLWLFNKTNPNDLQRLTLVKGHCANTVRHLMKDKRSIKAVDDAIAFGNGEIDVEKLNTAYADAADAAKKENQQQTADICRKYLPIAIWNIKL